MKNSTAQRAGIRWNGLFAIFRNRKWESEVCDALQIAERAAKKLRVEYERGSISPRCELDNLVANIDVFNRLKRGPDIANGRSDLSPATLDAAPTNDPLAGD